MTLDHVLCAGKDSEGVDIMVNGIDKKGYGRHAKVNQMQAKCYA